MKKSLATLAIASTLAACGGGGSSSTATATSAVLTGQFVDSAVINVSYSTSSGLVGSTDANGNYAYRAGDTVKFSIGKIVLGEGRAAATLTPIDLVSGATALDNPNVVKILQVLQTLDDDLDPSNGIKIPEAVVSRLAALASEKNVKDITDLLAGVINLAFASGAPALKTADAAKLHFAETLAAMESTNQLARLGGISNFVIGGGNRSCSSFNGDTKSSNCGADWATILAQDSAFAGLTKANISFDGTYVKPTFSYGISQAKIDAFTALPASLFNAGRKASTLTTLNSRLAAGNVVIEFPFADGLSLWNTALSNNDFSAMLLTMCGSASPTNGADCTLSNTNISAVQTATYESLGNRDQAVLVLRALQTKYGSGTIKYRRDSTGVTVTPNFRAEFQALQLRADGTAFVDTLTSSLTAAEKAVLRSVFVNPNPQINRKVEARSTKFLTDTASFNIFSQFVAAAKAANNGNTPTIGVVTASAENPFGDSDINVFALKSAGAKVVYLPFDGGFRKALDANSGAGDCNNTKYYYDAYANTNASGDYYNMDQVFPDLAKLQTDFCANGAATLNSTLEGLSGIYFSGGDQSRHLESFITKDASNDYTVVSPQATILKTRFAAGKLVVAGTSAGDHIQNGGVWKGKNVPMIGGGDSYATLKSGYIKGTGPLAATDLSAVSYANGGLGFFNYGVLDSHFTRRTREGRLVRHTKESGMDYGFGVDENTALVVGKPDAAGKTAFSVLGAAGVFIADVRSATATGGTTGNYSIEGVKTHYLTPGDTAEIDAAGNLTVTLSTTKPLLPLVATAATVKQTRVQDYGSSNFLALAKATGVNGAATGYGTTAESTDGNQSSPVYSATLTRSTATAFRGISNGRVSYTNVNLKFAPCATACVTP